MLERTLALIRPFGYIQNGRIFGHYRMSGPIYFSSFRQWNEGEVIHGARQP